MKVLSVDTCSEAASCSIISDDRLLGEITFNFEKHHSVVLMDAIHTLLTRTKLTINDLDGLVVSKGPGSFTGLRIGMATLKGIAMGSKKPLIAISSLDSLAYNLPFVDGIICPILDALRGNVYTNLYSTADGNLEILDDYLAISVEELASKLNTLNKKVFFIGDGTFKHFDFLNSNVNNAYFTPAHLNYTSASSLGVLGLKLLKEGASDNLNTLSPVYIRKSQAEREYDEKMEKLKNESNKA